MRAGEAEEGESAGATPRLEWTLKWAGTLAGHSQPENSNAPETAATTNSLTRLLLSMVDVAVFSLLANHNLWSGVRVPA